MLPTVNDENGTPLTIGVHGSITIELLVQHLSLIVLLHAILYCQTLVGSTIVIIYNFQIKNRIIWHNLRNLKLIR